MPDSIRRRDFLKSAGAQAGLLATGATGLTATTLGAQPVPGRTLAAPAVNGKTYDVAVVGAGAFGGWTAYHLRRLGASVVLVDAYGPGTPGRRRAPRHGACAPRTATGRTASNGCAGPVAPSSAGRRGTTNGVAT